MSSLKHKVEQEKMCNLAMERCLDYAGVERMMREMELGKYYKGFRE